MRFSVVIPTYNRKERLRRCLRSVSRQDFPDYEVIVVDDGSSDGTEKMVREEFPAVRYLRQGENRGASAARNRGVDASGAEIVAFTDDDCIVPARWLSTLAAKFGEHPGIAAVGGYQEAPEELLRARVAAVADRWMRLQRSGERAGVEQCGGSEVPGLATNNVAYRREVLLEVGGFDENIHYGEDADLKLRVSRMGHRLLYIPAAVEHWRDYTLAAQLRLHVRRGIGAYEFEAKHAHAPGAGRIALRLLKRSLWFVRDLISLHWRVAAVIYLSRVADCVGQLRALQASRRTRSP